MDTVTALILEAAEDITLYLDKHIEHDDLLHALSCIKIASERMALQDPIKRASRLAYDNLDSWVTGNTYSVRVEVLMELLSKEGLIRDERTEESR